MSVMEERDSRLYRERVHYLYEHLNSSVLGYAVVSVYLIFALQALIPRPQLLLWFSAACAVGIARFLLGMRYRAHQVNEDQANVWGTWFGALTIAQGLVWGLTGVLLFPENSIAHQIFVLFSVGGILAGALIHYSVFKRLYWSYVVLASGPLLLRFLFIGGDMGTHIFTLGVLFAAFMIVSSVRVHKIVVRSLKFQLRMEHLVNFDPLTEIPNRRYYEDVIAREWRRSARQKAPVTLMFLDVDYFKACNDVSGHQYGDKCLQAVANAISRACRRPGDFVARIGGEEFAVVLANTDLEGARQVAERIRQTVVALELKHPLSPISPYVTLSIGVVTQVADADADLNILVKAADAALYRAKEGGRNRVELGSYGADRASSPSPASDVGAQ